MPEAILLVEDKEVLREMVRLALTQAGHPVEEAADGAAALAKIRARRFPVIVTDLKLPGPNGLDILRAAKELDESVAVVIMTAFGSVDDAVMAMKEGALDFIQKPFEIPHLLLLVERALLDQARLRENLLWREEAASRYGLAAIIGEDASMKEVEQAIRRVATTGATVLLQGESGTGKELFARALHGLSPRRELPFVTINCAALPENLIENELFGHEKGAFTGAAGRKMGKVELANRGTLFLDEIAEMPPPAQAKLLRLIEEKTFERIGGTQTITVEVRIVAATNRPLRDAVEKKLFRNDLYFRLAAFPVEIPPLRRRGRDVLLLANYFLEKYAAEFQKPRAGLSLAAQELLLAYSWPGNVRELSNAIERAVILADSTLITPENLVLGFLPSRAAAPIPGDFNLSGSLAEVTDRVVLGVERAKIAQALEEARGNRTLAAEKLNVSTKTLLAKMRALGLDS
ncbi:MAG TPA: sigma-54 dependent transcriptional regulator [Terriglobia bacterium]|nr:sigma-54 dependent transcriptional regulator [Terriglobia bacterium]